MNATITPNPLHTEAEIRNILSTHLNNFYQENGLSVPSKTRTNCENKIIEVLRPYFNIPSITVHSTTPFPAPEQYFKLDVVCANSKQCDCKKREKFTCNVVCDNQCKY